MTDEERKLVHAIYRTQAACLLNNVAFFASAGRVPEFMPWQAIEAARDSLTQVLARKPKARKAA